MKTHYCIAAHLRSKLPSFALFGGSGAKQLQSLCDNLPEHFEDAQKVRGLSPGDMPPLDSFRERLLSLEDVDQLPKWDNGTLEDLDEVLAIEMPKLMASVGGVSASDLSTKEVPEPRGIMDRLRGG